MSNNDLKCSKCGCQHHPVECPKSRDWLWDILYSFDDGAYSILGAREAIKAEIRKRMPKKLEPDHGMEYEKGYNNAITQVNEALGLD